MKKHGDFLYVFSAGTVPADPSFFYSAGAAVFAGL